MNDPSIIKDLIQFSDEELTDEKVEEKLEETLRKIDNIAKTYKKIKHLRLKLDYGSKGQERPAGSRTMEPGPHARRTVSR